MNVVYVILSIMTISFLFAYINVSKKLGQVSAGFANLLLNYSALMQAKDSFEFKQDNVDIIDKEHFIKFLSDSRDWAFVYIEEVQKGLEKFIKEVEPHIEFYDNFGAVVEGMVQPHDTALKTISKEFKELKNLLPDKIND